MYGHEDASLGNEARYCKRLATYRLGDSFRRCSRGRTLTIFRGVALLYKLGVYIAIDNAKIMVLGVAGNGMCHLLTTLNMILQLTITM